MDVVVVTGAGQGLGRALAFQWASSAYPVIAVIRNPNQRSELEAFCPLIEVLIADITSGDYSDLLRQQLQNRSVCLVINNAGSGSQGRNLPSVTADQLVNEFNTHCVGALVTVNTALDGLRRAKKACVLNISSRRGSLTMQAEGAALGSQCSYSYRIGKAAQNMLTLCMTDDLQSYGIDVYAIHPGRVATKMVAAEACFTAGQAALKIFESWQGDNLLLRQLFSLESEKVLPW
ncbi:MAG: hypothetical protein CENE_03633 [Candidatus Celerinatantimonas neptuna]|nr:MAG: hypothetical protein CENE_03633 [Candidatus Celerinatantimonas neptuna]